MRRAAAPQFIALPRANDLFTRAFAHPEDIDDLVPQLVVAEESTLPSFEGKDLYPTYPVGTKTLANYIQYELIEFYYFGVTPELNWGGDPSRPAEYWRSALIYAIILGRSYGYVQSRLRIEGDDLESEMKSKLQRHSQQLDNAIGIVMATAFFSYVDIEPGARYVASIILLACSVELQRAGCRHKGKNHGFWTKEMDDLTSQWDFTDIRDAVFELRKLPRNNTDGEEMRQRKQYDAEQLNHLYIPSEVLKALDLAREHLRDRSTAGERVDEKSSEIVKLFTTEKA